MKTIGILGSGVVGQQLGLGFIKLGYEVMIGTRSSEKLNEWSKEAGDNASVGTFEEAAKFGDIIVLATLWAGTKNAIDLAGVDNFAEKVVIDVTNPLDFSNGFPPKLDASEGNSGSEKIQSWLPKAKVVKAFNTVSAYIMVNPVREEGKPDLFIAGEEPDAKKFVEETAKAWGWDHVHDLGDLSRAYWLETLAMVWIHFGGKHNHWTHAFKLLLK